MKIIILLVVIFYIQFGIAQVQINGPSIKFDETTHDFGNFKEADGSVEHTFEFTNNGTAELIIESVKASCGCTTPEWTKSPIIPGGKGTIKAAYNPEKRPGPFNKSLTIGSNAISQHTKLYIKGNVEPIKRSAEEEYPVSIGGMRLKYRTFSLEEITNEKPVTQIFSVFNDTNSEMSIKEEYRAPEHIKLKFLPLVLPAKTLGKVEVTYDPRKINMLGIRSDFIEFKTDEWFNSVKKIRILVSLEEYFPPMTPEQLSRSPRLKIENPFHDFGTIKQGESVTTNFIITNNGKEPLNIRQTRATCGCTASTPEKSNLRPGESSNIKVTFDSSGRSGEQSKTIFVFSNDPTNPTQKMMIKGVVKDEGEP
jgi:hypothetical protein